MPRVVSPTAKKQQLRCVRHFAVVSRQLVLPDRPTDSQPLVQVAKRAAREKFIKDPRLLDLFMAASAPAAAMQNRSDAQSPRSKGGDAAYSSDDRPLLSGAQAADIVWACGLLQWLPDEGGRLEHLLKLIALAAASPSGIDGWHVTNAVWALDRLGGFEPEMARAGLYRGNKAIEELREKVASLPFRAIPSLFEGLRVEDFRKEVDFGRDEILLGGGKVYRAANVPFSLPVDVVSAHDQSFPMVVDPRKSHLRFICRQRTSA